MFEAAGIEVLGVNRQILTEGYSIHELGTSRMGSDPKKSVVNQFQQSHDVKNLLVVDGSTPRKRLVPESDMDHHGAVLALVRSSGRRIEERGCLMSIEINRRDLIRIGAGAVLAAPAALASADAPKFFTPAEFSTLDELTEIVIPADEHSPGARAAKVAAYIDGSVAEAFEAKDRDEWRNGLQLVEALSQKMHDVAFMQATPEQRIALVAAMAKNETNPKTPEELFFVESEKGNRPRLLHLENRHSPGDGV